MSDDFTLGDALRDVCRHFCAPDQHDPACKMLRDAVGSPPSGEIAVTGASLIAAERQRQVSVEGYTPEHDDTHGWRALWLASMAYTDGYDWPWPAETFKPTNVIRDHIKAGALARAAVEVAERAGLPKIEWYPAEGALFQCERFLDDVLAGVADLHLPFGPRSYRPFGPLSDCGERLADHVCEDPLVHESDRITSPGQSGQVS